jgi:hypothetical protein
MIKAEWIYTDEYVRDWNDPNLPYPPRLEKVYVRRICIFPDLCDSIKILKTIF